MPSIVNANITMKTWNDFQTLLLYAVIGLIASIFVLGQCNLLALEDKTARSLGVNVTRSRIIISVIAVLLASISTAVIGPISFLGLIVPHIARLLVGSSHKVLVPYSHPAGSVHPAAGGYPGTHHRRALRDQRGPSSCRWQAARSLFCC